MGAGVVITGTSKCPVLFKFRSSLAFILLMVATAVFTVRDMRRNYQNMDCC
jgi:hypothetical protein